MSSSAGKLPRRQWDVVVFGATGQIGRLVCEYLAMCCARRRQHHTTSVEAPLRWAIAGRDRSKLLTLSEDLRYFDATPGLILADASDPRTLGSLCEKTHLLIDCVTGSASTLVAQQRQPSAGTENLGVDREILRDETYFFQSNHRDAPDVDEGVLPDAVVQACVQNRTDCIVVSSSISLHTRVRETYGHQATESNTLVVCGCDWNSVANDAAVLFTNDLFPPTRPEPLTIQSYVHLSGHTPTFQDWEAVCDSNSADPLLRVLRSNQPRTPLALPWFHPQLRLWTFPISEVASVTSRSLRRAPTQPDSAAASTTAPSPSVARRSTTASRTLFSLLQTTTLMSLDPHVTFQQYAQAETFSEIVLAYMFFMFAWLLRRVGFFRRWISQRNSERDRLSSFSIIVTATQTRHRPDCPLNAAPVTGQGSVRGSDSLRDRGCVTQAVVTRLRGPGLAASTAIFAVQSLWTLFIDREILKQQGGVGTAASILGHRFLRRLELSSEFEFSVVSERLTPLCQDAVVAAAQPALRVSSIQQAASEQ
eukprot:TRINITY_DN7300_c0_g1_i1.p1 TRINITY_DN7300_c0_g1~~TRINITY_DN7300_c0_g1_i1.p1  ORF type:complete len:552 (-),score=75.40 TRINITY_DN7300_c0_g1_i1:9-1613(-)